MFIHTFWTLDFTTLGIRLSLRSSGVEKVPIIGIYCIFCFAGGGGGQRRVRELLVLLLLLRLF